MILLSTSACVDYLSGNKEIKKKIEDKEDQIHFFSLTVYEMNIGFGRTKQKISKNYRSKRYKKL